MSKTKFKKTGNETITTTTYTKKESEDIKKDFELNQQQVRMQRARLLNEEVFDLYRIHLIKCSVCSGILALPQGETSCWCPHCMSWSESNESEDLFYITFPIYE